MVHYGSSVRPFLPHFPWVRLRVLSLVLILLGGAALLAPQARQLLPVYLPPSAWVWIGFGCIALAALVYFLTPKD